MENNELVSRYEDVIRLIKVLAKSPRPFLQEQEIYSVLKEKPLSFPSWGKLAQAYRTIFLIRETSKSSFSKSHRVEIALLDRADLDSDEQEAYRISNEKLEGLIDSLTHQFLSLHKIMNGLLENTDTIDQKMDIPRKKEWLERISQGETEQVIEELGEFLDQEAFLDSHKLSGFFMLKTRDERLRKKEQLLESIKPGPEYSALESIIEVRRNQIDHGLFIFLDHISN